ncbi:MAG: hypothetical protein E6J83_10030 [Deltaproteobacteria bacterium]|nr:MAG: hypothetical protein E6J83_10030 [Deltaproteobacteria bacterium]
MWRASSTRRTVRRTARAPFRFPKSGSGVFGPKARPLEAYGPRRYAALMGLTSMRLRVGNVARPEVTEELDFLVDSGAIYSVVPTEVLRRLGVQPLAEQEFRLANGTRIVRKKGVAFFRYEDRVGGADVIFGEPEDAVLLGAFTLEALGLCLDPLRRELLPVPMVLAAWSGPGRAVTPPRPEARIRDTGKAPPASRFRRRLEILTPVRWWRRWRGEPAPRSGSASPPRPQRSRHRPRRRAAPSPRSCGCRYPR